MRGREGRLAGGLVAALVIVIGIPLNVVSSYFPAAVTGHRLVWIGFLAGGIAVVAALTLLSRRLDAGARPALLGQVPPVVGWVERAELREVVSALTTKSDGVVALTTGLVGAGGFGKTMLAAQACRDRAVRRRFRGGIVWVTVGRDVDEAGLAARISEEIRILGGEGPAFTSLEQAGQALAEALRVRRRRTLLVADDVWTARQLEPFAAAGQLKPFAAARQQLKRFATARHAGRLLVTTRRPRVLDATVARRIEVDAVTGEVARLLLGRGLPWMALRQEHELLGLAGGWPLLLSLINRRLADDLDCGAAVDVAAAHAAARLRQAGPAALDVADERSRQMAVAATIGYSLETLSAADQDRFCELGIFAEEAEIPLAVVALLWRGTAGLDEAEATALCERLDGLSLVSLAWAGRARVMMMHDVIRDYAAARLGQIRASAVHAALISEARGGDLPGRNLAGHHR